MSPSQEEMMRQAKELFVSPCDSALTKEILFYRRNYFKNKVKEPLMKALVWAFDKRARTNPILDRIKLFMAVWNVMQTVNRYPEPTRDNCHYPLVLGLMDIWDEFFKWEDNPEHPDSSEHPFFGRVQLYRAFRRAMLATLEHDHYYRQRGHWWTKKIYEAYRDGKIPELPLLVPDRRVCWKEPVDKKELEDWIQRQFITTSGGSR